MSKGKKIVAIVFITLAVSFIAFFLYHWRNSAKETAYLSCLSSIGSEVWKLEATKNLAAKNETWKILSSEETDFLLSQAKGYDCGGIDNQTLDLWNNRIYIALRKPTNRFGIIIWSNGADKISGTEDDLVIPFGRKVPKQ